MTDSQKQFYKIMKTMLNNKPKQKLPEPKVSIFLNYIKSLNMVHEKDTATSVDFYFITDFRCSQA